MRSVVVVLPASMCAMMPMLRTLSSAISRAVISRTFFFLPAVVREGLVGLGHLGHVLTTLHCSTDTVTRVNDLIGEPLGHGLFAALLREIRQPADSQCSGATRTNLHRHLVRGATDAATLYFQLGANVLQGPLQGRDGVGAGLLLDLLEGGVDNALGDGALAALEDLVGQLGDQDRLVDRVDGHFATKGGAFTRHCLLLPLGAVAATGLLAVAHTRGVECAADDLVANARQVLHTAASHEDDRVLLEVVADTGDVGRDLDARRETHTRDLAKRGVRLLRGHGVDAGTHTTTLRGPLQGWRLGLGYLVLSALSDQLCDCGHAEPLLVELRCWSAPKTRHADCQS